MAFEREGALKGRPTERLKCAPSREPRRLCSALCCPTSGAPPRAGDDGKVKHTAPRGRRRLATNYSRTACAPLSPRLTEFGACSGERVNLALPRLCGCLSCSACIAPEGSDHSPVRTPAGGGGEGPLDPITRRAALEMMRGGVWGSVSAA